MLCKQIMEPIVIPIEDVIDLHLFRPAEVADLLDNYFRESFAGSVIGPRIGILKNPYAIIALGGYGRQEQCTHSDVDLLFLFEKDC